MITRKAVIIIPTYNEALVIQDTLAQIFELVSQIHHLDIHVLVFDSQSTDDTVALVHELQKKQANLHVLVEPQKTGLGSAYLQAMQHAIYVLSADIIVEMDADLSHQPHYLIPMFNALNDYDVVVGSRYVAGGKIPDNWGLRRVFLSVVGNALTRLILTTKIRDFTSGFRMTRTSALAKVLPTKFMSNHYAYKLELFWRLFQSGATIKEYPIEFIDREKGDSKLPANSLIDSLRVIAWLRMKSLKKYGKMCVVGVLGMAIQYVVYNSLRKTLMPFHATQVAVSAALINNFILNSQFTFKSQVPKTWRDKISAFLFFVTYSFFMIEFQSHCMDWGIYFFGRGVIKENIILLGGILLGSVLNYQIYSKLIWGERLRNWLGAKFVKLGRLN